MPNSVVVGEADNKKYLKDMNVSVANTRSGEYKPVKTGGIKIRGSWRGYQRRDGTRPNGMTYTELNRCNSKLYGEYVP
jgi:hypothetical protein